MIKSLSVKNFSLFCDANFDFVSGINVFLGDNATGKSSVLRLCHTATNTSFNAGNDVVGKISIYNYLSSKLKSSLAWNFHAKEVCHLSNFNLPDHTKTSVSLQFEDPEIDLQFSFNNMNSISFSVDNIPSRCIGKKPIWADQFFCIQDMPDLNYNQIQDSDAELISKICQGIVDELKLAVGKGVDIDHFGRSRLIETEEPLHFGCFSSSIIKMIVFLRLIKTGSIFGGGHLFLDCVDNGMDCKLLQIFASTLFSLAQSGTQIFISTQSQNLVQKIHELHDASSVKCKYFYLSRDGDDIAITSKHL